MGGTGSHGAGSNAGGDTPARHFINHLDVSLSLSEVRFDLAMVGALPGAATSVWRFVTTPDHLQTIHGDISVALDSYEARFGKIRAGGYDRGAVGFHKDSDDG